MSKGKRTKDRAGAIASFLNGLKLPARDAERIAVLLQDMGVENEDYLEILATLEMRDQWLEELGEEGDLTPIQVRLLKEGLDRLGMGAK
ncbi:hypothetical protein TRAPUB_6135 [Trametes pubescens]|uniref:Uncharacterized protein n=1 Tax=Trametes pubescens TaxID=154538 RepID=A0A1M2V6N9_TRAPU|nr:hypothetical protein TRAPUB_6135 [Trametes pubescens]